MMDNIYGCFWASQVVLVVKNMPASGGDARYVGLILGLEIPWSKKCQPALVFLPGKSHGQKNLEGYSLWTVLERIVDGTAGKPQGQGLNPNSLQCSSDTDYLELIRSRCTG